jgi:hypothetical protein
MRPVDSVKIAHADQRGAEVCRNVFEFVENLHRQELTAESAEFAERSHDASF